MGLLGDVIKGHEQGRQAYRQGMDKLTGSLSQITTQHKDQEVGRWAQEFLAQDDTTPQAFNNFLRSKKLSLSEGSVLLKYLKQMKDYTDSAGAMQTERDIAAFFGGADSGNVDEAQKFVRDHPNLDATTAGQFVDRARRISRENTAREKAAVEYDRAEDARLITAANTHRIGRAVNMFEAGEGTPAEIGKKLNLTLAERLGFSKALQGIKTTGGGGERLVTVTNPDGSVTKKLVSDEELRGGGIATKGVPQATETAIAKALESYGTIVEPGIIDLAMSVAKGNPDITADKAALNATHAAGVFDEFPEYVDPRTFRGTERGLEQARQGLKASVAKVVKLGIPFERIIAMVAQQGWPEEEIRKLGGGNRKVRGRIPQQ